ncbi:MAG TPA: pyruvate ferredoxin oxidoreductase [Methanocorpusculum sp.]|nr:pyruvate ferredoxin oxidoreductase [Methanocorpusculum sp.]
MTSNLKISTGNKAMATAVKMANPTVVAAYPITPQTEIIEAIANYVESGQMPTTRYIPVESEHSAMTACIGAAATGSRVFTATSSHGLLYMHEMLHWAAGARLPIVMGQVNRTVAPGWNIWADHTDSLSQRDTGWLQVYVSTVQEVYDTTLMAFKIAEDTRVLLPIMINMDGFLLSHIMQPFEMTDPKDFIPPIKLPHKIDVNSPKGYGAMSPSTVHFKFRWDLEKSMRDSRSVINECETEFSELFGRSYGPIDEYKCDDADVIVVALGTLGKESEVAVDMLRNDGIKAGVMRIRWLRPFPLNMNIKDKELVVIDRDYSYGFGGILANEIKSHYPNTKISSIIAGIGGQEVTYNDIYKFIYNRKIGTEHWFGIHSFTDNKEDI